MSNCRELYTPLNFEFWVTQIRGAISCGSEKFKKNAGLDLQHCFRFSKLWFQIQLKSDTISIFFCPSKIDSRLKILEDDITDYCNMTLFYKKKIVFSQIRVVFFLWTRILIQNTRVSDPYHFYKDQFVWITDPEPFIFSIKYIHLQNRIWFGYLWALYLFAMIKDNSFSYLTYLQIYFFFSF